MTTIKLRQELHSFVNTFVSCIVLTLVLGGIGGTIYKMISPEGWIATAFGRSLSAGAASLGSMALIAGLAWFSRSWAPNGERPFFWQFMIYLFDATVFVYLVMLWTKGAL